MYLVDMNDENMKNFKYEKLFDGKVCEQLNIAKIFKQNMKNRDEILEQRRNSSTENVKRLFDMTAQSRDQVTS